MLDFLFRAHQGTPASPVPELFRPECEAYTTRALKFRVLNTDGGQYSSDYSCANMLRPDNTVYSTNKQDNVNVLLKFDEEGSFVLTHVIVKSPDHRYGALTCVCG